MSEIIGKSKPSTMKKVVRRILSHENATLILILIVITAILAFATKGLIVKRQNIINIWAQSSTRGIVTIGQLFVLLCGGIDLSVGGIAGLTGMIGAVTITSGYANIIGRPLPLGTGVVIVMAVGLGVGLINGLVVSRLRVAPLIATLGMWIMSGGITFMFSRGFTVADLPRNLDFFGQQRIADVPMPIFIFIAIIGVAYFVLYYTELGRSIYAVGGNLLSAWLSGINVRNTQLVVYIISGFLAGVSGLVLISRSMSASVNTGIGLELDSITAVCLGGVSLQGGRGTLLGAVIGIIIIITISSGMNILAVDPPLQNVVKGAILIAAVAVDARRRQ